MFFALLQFYEARSALGRADIALSQNQRTSQQLEDQRSEYSAEIARSRSEFEESVSLANEEILRLRTEITTALKEADLVLTNTRKDFEKAQAEAEANLAQIRKDFEKAQAEAVLNLAEIQRQIDAAKVEAVTISDLNHLKILLGQFFDAQADFNNCSLDNDEEHCAIPLLRSMNRYAESYHQASRRSPSFPNRALGDTELFCYESYEFRFSWKDKARIERVEDMCDVHTRELSYSNAEGFINGALERIAAFNQCAENKGLESCEPSADDARGYISDAFYEMRHGRREIDSKWFKNNTLPYRARAEVTELCQQVRRFYELVGNRPREYDVWDDYCRELQDAIESLD